MNKLLMTKAQTKPCCETAPAIAYLIGVDGGGTGTRVVLADPDGMPLARGIAGPSALAHGRQQAWDAILLAIADAFAQANLALPALSVIAIACGLSGVNNTQWAAELKALNPGFALLLTETDAGTTLIGAHQGAPGAVIALGTGSVGEVLQSDGQRREVGGWGFPVSDEASGAWLGMRAVNYLQRVLDGRATSSRFADAIYAHCGGDKDAVFRWLAQANQTRYAEVAPLVFQHAAESAFARDMLLDAGREVEAIADALDPAHALPLALCGGLAAALMPFLPDTLRQRVRAPLGDSASGALILLQQHLRST
ncbi:BadF/BadG/BcrA/BcrD ATPase family protein [Undibacterium sp. 14-3-2]|uniref:BadF/BadG/BcrA/BcrD ATPase family protein n=1 Tax=Undibacterium sp. 14-3-2 TaxID=2800129 RepID=UPI001F1CD693|nr:BadF/BadG/BcrA/BcrD ATPase family protein [Undibacterium sp. 14-3-2]